MSRWLRYLACIALAVCAASVAQAYPDRPVRLIVPFTAGGGTDAMTRILADRLQQRLGPRFLVENVAGAGGNAGADRASHAQPDGYTLLIGSMGILTVIRTLSSNRSDQRGTTGVSFESAFEICTAAAMTFAIEAESFARSCFL